MNMLEGMPQRQAALLLHAISDVDRAWVLASLPVQDSDALTLLLNELRDMEVAPDPQWVARWVPPTTTTKPDAIEPYLFQSEALDTQPPVSQALTELMALSPDQVAALARLLSAEPIELTLRLLRVKPWPWREKLLSHMSASAQMRLRQGLLDMSGDGILGAQPADPGYVADPSGRSAEQALLAALARRMAKVTPTVVAKNVAAAGGAGLLPRQWMGSLRNIWSMSARPPL